MESFLHIENFESRYHLPASQLPRRERLDRVLDTVLDQTLEIALESVGISPQEEICIRKLHIPVKLSMSGSDQSLALDWSLAIAGSLQEVIAQNEPSNVIRYASRLHGLIDFATGVAKGDYQRAWAWQQLGMISETRLDSNKTAADALVNALVNEPVWIIPVLTSLARAKQFHRLAGRIQVQAWTDLAVGALAAYGADHQILKNAEHHREAAPEIYDPNISAIAARIAAHSAFTPTLRYHPRLLDSNRISLWPLAVFALLDAEPGLLTQSTGQTWALLQLTAEAWQELGGGFEPDGADVQILESRNKDRRRDQSSLSWPRVATRAPAAGTPGNKPARDRQGFEARVHLPVAPEGGGRQPGARKALFYPNHRKSGQQGFQGSDTNGLAGMEDAAKSISGMAGKAISQQPDNACPDVRRIGLTEFGGLIFLLPHISQIGIVDAINATHLFKQRPLRWVLYRLALGLMPLDEDDPAALAFCGLRPGDEPPWFDAPGPCSEEKKLLAEWNEQIVESLRIRLSWQDTAGKNCLFWVCYRRARIVADPGWIEVVFSIKDVSTVIRRAALDLDPGFLPWLGAVIKFTYE
jgi:hypothetical protein